MIWVRASQAGDPSAFNRLVLKWEKQIYNLSLRMLQNPEDAADSTQEIFLLAFRSIRKFRRNSRFSTWLYRIAVNHCISSLQRRPSGVFFDSEEMERNALKQMYAVSGHQEKKILHNERRQKIMDSMALLPPEQRVIIELKFFQEETFEEISRILSIPQSTIKSRFYSSLEILRDRLGYCSEEIL
jgi:RNA polymerase sigma-70 factor (ECF subfamily)